MAVKIGSENLKRLWVGTSRIRLAYLEKQLIFAEPQTLVISMNEGVASVIVNFTGVDGGTGTETLTGSANIELPYGASVSLTAKAKEGYTIDAYGVKFTITRDWQETFRGTAKVYQTSVDLFYGGDKFDSSKGDRIGTFQYSTNQTTWSDTVSFWNGNMAFGSVLYLRNVSAAPGFRILSVTYNDQTIVAVGGVYAVPIASGNYEARINVTSTISSSSVDFVMAADITTNSLIRNAWLVDFDLDILVEKCTAGTVIGTTPYQFRPASNYSFVTDWYVTSGVSSSVTPATITVRTDGTIVSSADSNGRGSAGGGGKWGGGVTTWITKIQKKGTWSVK